MPGGAKGGAVTIGSQRMDHDRVPTFNAQMTRDSAILADSTKV